MFPGNISVLVKEASENWDKVVLRHDHCGLRIPQSPVRRPVNIGVGGRAQEKLTHGGESPDK